MCGLAAGIVGVLLRKIAPVDLSGQVISSENVFREGGTQIFLKHDENNRDNCISATVVTNH